MILSGVFLLYLANTLLKGRMAAIPHTPGEMLGQLFGELASSIAGNFAYDKCKALSESLDKTGLPVNHDINKAVEKALLHATMEAIRFILRNNACANKQEEEQLLSLQRQFRKEIRETESKSYRAIIPNPLADQIEYLDLAGIPAEKEEELEKIMLDYVIEQKIKKTLWVISGELKIPTVLEKCLRYGWTENDKAYTLFKFCCDYFHETLKVDTRLQQIIEKQWLAQLLENTRESNATLQLFGEQVKKLGESAIQTVGKIDKLLAYANPQPLLSYRTDELSSDKPSHYKSRYTPFVGRDEAMQELETFFNEPDALAWWVITGAGGSGKNRLAIEFCYYLEERHNTHCGLMNAQQFLHFNWVNWQPESRTCIIIDYAGTIAEQIAETLQQLFIKREQLSYPVRFILLERQAEGADWWRTIRKDYIDRSKIPACWRPPLKLAPMDQSHLWSIIRHILVKTGKPLPEESSILQSLAKIDPSGRPIFALLAAFSIDENNHIRATNVLSLLEENYERELSLLTGAGFDKSTIKKMIRLACYATLVKGITSADISALIAERLPWLEMQENEFSNELYSMIASIDRANAVPYRPIEPDIIGEFFILQQLKPNPDNPFDQSPVPQMLEKAWDERTASIREFTVLLFEDFHELVDLGIFFKEPSPDDPREKYLNWSVLLSIAIGISTAGHFALSRQLYDRYNRYTDSLPDKSDYLHIRLMTTSFLVRYNTDPENAEYFLSLTNELSPPVLTPPVTENAIHFYIDLLDALGEYGLHIGDVGFLNRTFKHLLELIGAYNLASSQKLGAFFNRTWARIFRAITLAAIDQKFNEIIPATLDYFKQTLIETSEAEAEYYADALKEAISAFDTEGEFLEERYIDFKEFALSQASPNMVVRHFLTLNTRILYIRTQKEATGDAAYFFEHSKAVYKKYSADREIQAEYLSILSIYILNLLKERHYAKSCDLLRDITTTLDENILTHTRYSCNGILQYVLQETISTHDADIIHQAFGVLTDYGIKYREFEDVRLAVSQAYNMYIRFLCAENFGSAMASYEQYKLYIEGFETPSTMEKRGAMLHEIISVVLKKRQHIELATYYNELLQASANYRVVNDIHFVALHTFMLTMQQAAIAFLPDFDRWREISRRLYFNIQLHLIPEHREAAATATNMQALNSIRTIYDQYDHELEQDLADAYIEASIKLDNPEKWLAFCRAILLGQLPQGVTETGKVDALTIRLARELIHKYRHHPLWQEYLPLFDSVDR